MCYMYQYELVCEHVFTYTQQCPESLSSATGHPCLPSSVQVFPVTGPPTPDFVCCVPDCPFEASGRCWNCCWCGKTQNVKGRCSCKMIGDNNATYLCGHICCTHCQPSH